MESRDLSIGDHDLAPRITTEHECVAQAPALALQRSLLRNKHGILVAVERILIQRVSPLWFITSEVAATSSGVPPDEDAAGTRTAMLGRIPPAVYNIADSAVLCKSNAEAVTGGREIQVMSHPLKPGEVLRGRYTIRERIGQGGMGSIYLAEDNRLEGRVCALKEVEYGPALPRQVSDQARAQFLREATILARLDHANLPKVSDYFLSGPCDYLIMDYVPGKDLRQRMLDARRQHKFLSEAEVLGWAAQLADALRYLHQQEPPIIHRDIKPSNLKITPDGRLKLVDFGLVKIMAPEEVTITIIQGKGTALYTPLEQYGGDDAHTDVRADLYAFGATLYHLLTNEPPADARRRFLEAGSLARPREINPSISARTENALLWAMALHPDERPASIVDLGNALFGRGQVGASISTGTAIANGYSPETLAGRAERMLSYAVVALFVAGLLLTLLR